MDILFEFLFELYAELIMMFVPEKNTTKKSFRIIVKIVAAITVIINLFLFLWGIYLITDYSDYRGFILISLTIILFIAQIAIGIRINAKKETAKIRKAVKADLPDILKVYEKAREFMKNSGNPDQWGDTYPPKEDLIDDIDKELLYVLINDSNEIYAAFLLMEEPEPTYYYIDGMWRDNSAYATIHKVASNGTEKNVFKDIVEYTMRKYNHIRIDTHKQNLKMQHLIEKQGFKYCGIIYLLNGDSRMAYEYVNKGVKYEREEN